MAATTAQDGFSTATVKLGAEQHYAYSLYPVKDVGVVAVSEAGSGTWTPSTNTIDALDAAGEDLCVQASVPVNPTSDLVVTVHGTDQGASPITGVATITKGVSKGQSFTVIQAAGTKFASVTSITFTGGVLGDEFHVRALPSSGSFVDMKYIQSANFNDGTTVKPIPVRYEPVDHVKRARGDSKLTMTEFYTKNTSSLRKIKERTAGVTLRQEIHEDGKGNASEVYYYPKCMLSAPANFPEGNAESVVNAEGNYATPLIFS